MSLRDHATRVIDYSIRTAFIAIVIVPLLFFLSWGPSLGTEPPDCATEIFGIILIVVISPAYYAVRLLHALGISLDFVDWTVSVAVVPLCWGATAYLLFQSFRLTKPASRQR